MTSTDPLNLDAIEARATHPDLTPGPWRLDREQCDCSDGYCSDGEYVTGVLAPVPTGIAAERLTRTGEQPRDYDYHRSEFGDFTDADWELIAAARTDVPLLLAEVRRLRARTLTEAEHDRAWHAIEGTAGEEGADPGTVLNAVLHALGLTAP